MKKGQRRKDNAAKRKHPRANKPRKNLHKNPMWPDPVFELNESGEAYTLKDGPLSKFLADSAGTLAVQLTLQGATLHEKTVIAAMIPMILKWMRAIPKGKTESIMTTEGMPILSIREDPED